MEKASVKIGRKTYHQGDILKVDLGIRMDSEIKESRYLYLEVYLDEGTWMVTAVGGWIPALWSDWTLPSVLANGANKSVKILKGKKTVELYGE